MRRQVCFFSISIIDRNNACLGCQAIDVSQYLFTFDEDSLNIFVIKWIIVDALYILGLSQLRIPRLRYSPAIVALQIMSLCLLDGILFGGISINLGLGLSVSSLGFSGPCERFFLLDVD